MADITVAQLAKQARISVDILLAKLEKAGLPQRSADDLITSEQKKSLFKALQPQKVTLKERTSGKISLSGQNKGRSVGVQVKKKKTYVSSNDKLVSEEEVKRNLAIQEAKKKAEEEAARRKLEEEKSAQDRIEPKKKLGPR